MAKIIELSYFGEVVNDALKIHDKKGFVEYIK
jgi:hypothetical protein